MTQQQAVKMWLKDNESITSYEAFLELGIIQLPYVIKMLEKKGLTLFHKQRKRLNRYGKTVKYMQYTRGW